jgi:eukaryotic-like serine/threonine-protein kinase
MDRTLSPPAGQLLDGRYRIEAQLARGGMATVYLATDTRLDRTVALKIVHQELAVDEEWVSRFDEEARSAARLSSQNIVAVYDQGSDGPLHFLAMEYVPGQTLRELLDARGSLDPPEALHIIDGVLRGLAAAHAAGIVHRDVKPENVLLTRFGEVKVADFGLARATSATSHTKAGMIIGTAAYLAPEQVSPGTADARTDVYAAGIVLFELLTGRQPFIADTALAVAYKHVNEAVPAPSQLVPGLPPAIDALVAMATSRDPELRPADASQFLDAVTAVRGGLPVPGPPRPGRHAAASGQDRSGGWPPLSGQRAAAGERARSWPDAADPTANSWPDAADPTANSWPDAADPTANSWPDAADPTANSWSGLDTARDQPGPPAPLSAPPAAAAPPPLVPVPAPPADQAETAPPGAVPPVGGLAALGFGVGGRDGGLNHTLIVRPDESAPNEPGDRYPRPRRRDRRREPLLQHWLFSRRLLYVALVIALALAAGLGIWWVINGQYSNVPRVTGMTAKAARTELRDLGFAVRTGDPKHSKLAKGEVIGTRPPAGSRAAHGSTVTITVSLGPPQVAVPQVTGMPLTTAEATLTKAGLKFRTRAAPSTTVPPGTVILTKPMAGTLWPKTRPVLITVSAGPPLPNFVGQPLQAAQQAASQGHYTINPVTDARGTAPAGTIVRQSTPPNTPISPGEVVTVYVSPGPPLAAVPNVQGLYQHRAVQLLVEAGFRVQVNKGIGDRVFSYSPTGKAPKGSTITINVGFTLP